MEKEVFPMVVQALVDEGDGESSHFWSFLRRWCTFARWSNFFCTFINFSAEHLGHAHILLATFEKVHVNL